MYQNKKLKYIIIKPLKILLFIYLFSTLPMFSQLLEWETESDTISSVLYEKLISTNIDYNFITDDGQLVSVARIKFGSLLVYKELCSFPMLRVFNTSTGEEKKIEYYGFPHLYVDTRLDTNWHFLGDSLDPESLNDPKNWVQEIDTVHDTIDITYQLPIKTIKVGDEYWFICGSWYLQIPEYISPAPYLVKMDKDFNIIEKIDKTSKNNITFPDSTLKNIVTSIFYDEIKKCFICFTSLSNWLIIQQFDSNFNKAAEDLKERFPLPAEYNANRISGYDVKAEQLSNGNYVVWFSVTALPKVSSSFQQYNITLHRIYDSDLNIIKECKRERNDITGYLDSGIVKAATQIINKPEGGYFICASNHSNAGIFIEEYSLDGDSIRTIYFDISNVFPECINIKKVLYIDGRFIYMGISKEGGDEVDNVFYTAYLVESDYEGNILWKYQVPFTFIGAKPDIIAGENSDIYYLSGVNCLGPNYLDTKNITYLFNHIHMKINRYSSVLSKTSLSHINLSPNPTHSISTLQLDLDSSGDLYISLTSLSGSEVIDIYRGYSDTGLFTKTFSIDNLPKGVYFLNVLHNGELKIEKIIKE